jgi:hypothetical protein
MQVSVEFVKMDPAQLFPLATAEKLCSFYLLRRLSLSQAKMERGTVNPNTVTCFLSLSEHDGRECLIMIAL